MAASVHILTEDEVPVAYATLAIAFDRDPIYRFLLPEPAERRRWLEVIMALSIHEACASGRVFTPSAGAGAGVAILHGPGSYPAPAGRGLFGFLIGRLPRPQIPAPTLRLLRHGRRVFATLARVHLTRPHYYLPVIGLHPDRAGQGLGRLLLDHAIALARTDRVPLYLETSNPDNLAFYDHFGFAVASEVVPVASGPPIWTMICECGPG